MFIRICSHANLALDEILAMVQENGKNYDFEQNLLQPFVLLKACMNFVITRANLASAEFCRRLNSGKKYYTCFFNKKS